MLSNLINIDDELPIQVVDVKQGWIEVADAAMAKLAGAACLISVMRANALFLHKQQAVNHHRQLLTAVVAVGVRYERAVAAVGTARQNRYAGTWNAYVDFLGA